MPPCYTKIHLLNIYDGLEFIDFIELGLSALYYPDIVTKLDSDTYFQTISTTLSRHSYIGSFGRITTPPRATFASVPSRPFYRYKGKNITPSINTSYNSVIDSLKLLLPDGIDDPDASISNGYVYNGKDSIATHTDDEKFLKRGNCSVFPDQATVCTFTLLNPNDPTPMIYCLGNPVTGIGYGIKCRSGSLLIQGNVLHSTIPSSNSKLDNEFNRISVTLRKLDDSHPCKKISCPYIYGPSNYIYYSGSYSYVLI